MTDLRELYQEVILDHNSSPRNFGPLADHNRAAEGHNPLCGDEITVYLIVKDGRVADIHFEGNGCAISMASASLMTELVKGRTEDEARALFARFRASMMGETEAEIPDDEDDEDALRLSVLSGVREFPVRVKCATLAWHTFASALANSGETVVTE
ncbi:MAG: Fe-S cluster assembly sulfur transfer protein SufU [Alphaproteobacteria bacterium]